MGMIIHSRLYVNQFYRSRVDRMNIHKLSKFKNNKKNMFVNNKPKFNDISTNLLEKKVIFVGMPLSSPVCELIFQELLWLNLSKQILDASLLINSSSSRNKLSKDSSNYHNIFCL